MSSKIVRIDSKSDEQVIVSLKKGEKAVFQSFYLQEQEGFIGYVIKNYKEERGTVIDFYHEAIIVLYENIVAGKLDDLSSSLKTYLYAIGKHLLSKHFSKKEMLERHEAKLTEHLSFLVSEQSDAVPVEHYSKMKEEVSRLKDPCRSLLLYFYYERLSTQTISEKMGYKNASVVKNQKKRCMNHLKERMETLKITLG